jgi:hypothetical protein
MATIVYDLKVQADENGIDDLVIDSGDFVITPSDKQHVKDIFNSVPGWWKEFPLVGFNPFNRINSRESVTSINQSAKIQLRADGYEIGPQGINIERNQAGELVIKTIDVFRP